MKSNLLFAFLVITQILSAQNFSEAILTSGFDGVEFSSIASSDVDGDGDSDVLLTGLNNSDERISRLYTNDSGNFAEVMDTPFDGVESGSIAFSDIDGDGDEDVLITGRTALSPLARISKLYTNNGGNFTEVMDTPFDAIRFGSIAFSDIDGDGDSDLLITGNTTGLDLIAKLYTNENGSFTEVMNTPFDGTVYGSITFSDVDGDGDNDVLLTGENSSIERIAKLFINDGGSFTEVTGTPFDGAVNSSTAFSDIDGDGDSDVLITGRNSSDELIAKLYANDGGNFTEVMGTPFEGVRRGSIAFSDVDGDGDEDVLITGENNTDERIAKLYTNDGGNFTEVMGTPFYGVRHSSVAFSDIDGDGDEDVLITGEINTGVRTALLYLNNQIVSSTHEIRSNSELLLYPNPSSSTLSVNYNSEVVGKITMRVYSANGTLLSQQSIFTEIGQQTFAIDIASFAKGVYFIELDNDRSSDVAKFMVQ